MKENTNIQVGQIWKFDLFSVYAHADDTRIGSGPVRDSEYYLILEIEPTPGPYDFFLTAITSGGRVVELYSSSLIQYCSLIEFDSEPK